MGLWQTLGTGTERGRACRCLRWTGALVSYSFNGVIYLFQGPVQTHTHKEGGRGKSKRDLDTEARAQSMRGLESAAISHQMDVNSNTYRYWCFNTDYLHMSYMIPTKLQFQDAVQLYILERDCMQFATCCIQGAKQAMQGQEYGKYPHLKVVNYYLSLFGSVGYFSQTLNKCQLHKVKHNEKAWTEEAKPLC